MGSEFSSGCPNSKTHNVFQFGLAFSDTLKRNNYTIELFHRHSEPDHMLMYNECTNPTTASWEMPPRGPGSLTNTWFKLVNLTYEVPCSNHLYQDTKLGWWAKPGPELAQYWMDRQPQGEDNLEETVYMLPPSKNTVQQNHQLFGIL